MDESDIETCYQTTERRVDFDMSTNDDESDQAFRQARTPSIAHDMHNQLNTFIRE